MKNVKPENFKSGDDSTIKNNISTSLIAIEDRKNELSPLIENSLDKLYKNDLYLLKIKAHERSIVFRFGLYFNDFLKKTEYRYLNLDFDYNRSNANKKETRHFPKGIFPDLILHERGSNTENILVIEFKTFWNRNISKDILKLEELTDSNQKYKYQLGISLFLGKKREECKHVFVKND